jgi:hypothetical protein
MKGLIQDSRWIGKILYLDILSAMAFFFIILFTALLYVQEKTISENMRYYTDIAYMKG